MIGVVARAEEHDIVREFFELFKTPWEFCRDNERYRVLLRYELFQEIRFLLTTGQPPENAAIPTLERHIALLRRWIIGSGIPLVEIPPVPEGHPFIACLTHDLDHPSLRFHRFDHTTLG